MTEFKTVQQKILFWYALHKRELPWRQTTDPYKILVSEVMLQQTQVDRVISFYERWTQDFPDFTTLARASPEEVLAHWSGLGYNQRALRLKELAKKVCKEHEGMLPQDESSLLSLPGIGRYTARAILSFAWNKEVAVIDTNIRRVLISELKLKEDVPLKKLEIMALQLIPRGKSREWHNALMDYGATVLTSSSTGIKPLSKQSSFKGSDREVRGWIVKTLVKGKIITLQDVQRQFPKKDVRLILDKMRQERIIAREGSRIRIYG